MSDYEGDGSPENILEWLNEAGYSGELHFNGERTASITDADDDYGSRRVPVAAVRKLIAEGKIAVWHDSVYRPTWWVEAWNRGERPWGKPLPPLIIA